MPTLIGILDRTTVQAEITRSPRTRQRPHLPGGRACAALLLHHHRGHHPEHPARGLGVGQDVAV